MDIKCKIRVFSLVCFLFVLIFGRYYVSNLNGYNNPRMKDGTRESANRRQQYLGESQMTLTRIYNGQDQKTTARTWSPEKDDASDEMSLKQHSNKLVPQYSTVKIPTPRSDFIEQLNALPTTSKQDWRQTEDILRESINNHHIKNFLKPENETCKQRLPTCILIGVFKSGTRELVDFLRLHPHIEIFARKRGYEMSFFSKNYGKGEDWLKQHMPCSYSNQITLMKHAGYFHNTIVPERIKRFNEKVKLILMVREPFSRALSSYVFRQQNHQKKFGYIQENTFSSLVLNADGNAVLNSSFYVRHSVYDEPMMFWLKYFNLSQFLVVESDEFKHDPVSVLHKVERFLGLENLITPDMVVLNKEKGFYCIQSDLTDTGMACYPENRGKKKQITVSPRTKAKLKEYFKPKNERFFKIIGKSFNWM